MWGDRYRHPGGVPDRLGGDRPLRPLDRRWYRKNIGEVETSIDKGERVDDKRYEAYTKLMADRGLPAKPNAPPAASPAPPTD